MIVPEEDLPPPTEVELMTRKAPPRNMTAAENKLYAPRPPSALLIQVCRARDLLMLDYNWLTRTGSSDPMVSLRIEGRDVTEETSTQFKTTTPTWEEDFVLPTDDPAEVLKVTVMDYDRFGANDFMGQVRIPLHTLKDRALHTHTYLLTDKKGSTKKKRGTIDLCLRWVHDPEHAVIIDHSYSRKEEYPMKEANAVRILLIRGRNLKAMDRQLFSGKEGTSDPMVTFKLKDTVEESTVQSKTISPEWLESFEIRADDPDDCLIEVRVDDWDQLSGNDCMGRCWIDVGELRNRKLHRRWYALLPEKSMKPEQYEQSESSSSGGSEDTSSASSESDAEHVPPPSNDPGLGKLELAVRWMYLPDFDLPVPDQMKKEQYPHEKINALHVYLIRGTHLPAVDLDLTTGLKTSDPLVTFVLEEERKNSKVKKKTLEPVWTEYFDLSVEGVLEDQTLQVTCDDWDMIGKNDFMGQCGVPLERLLDRRVHRAWHWLLSEDGLSAERGKLEIALRLYHNPAYVFATPERLLDATNDATHEANCLLVHVIRARGLPVMDPSVLGSGGSADPLLRLHLSGDRERTQIQRQTLAPIWEETFALKCDFATEVLELTLWDFDTTSANDEIGAVYVPVGSLVDRELHRAWYPIKPQASEDGLVDNLEPLSRHALKYGELVVSRGSVIEAKVHAIVNAANETCLGGGGVDGAISNAGGALLHEKRSALPCLDGKRCHTGDAVVTLGGPFGSLTCDCVVHAVGPDYRRLEDGDALLKSAYQASMARAKESNAKTVAFALLSAGIFRGTRSLEHVLHIAVEALAEATYRGLQRVHLVCFSEQEQATLERVASSLYPPIKRGRLELALRWKYDPQFFWEAPLHMHVPEAYPDLAPNRLDVFVTRGKHLPIMDWDRTSPSGGSSDAVCTLVLEGDHRNTSVKLTTLNPTWAEHFAFDAFEGEILKIHVDDWDPDGDLDPMGHVEVDPATLAERTCVRKWYAIRHEGPLSEGQPVRGHVEVCCRWSHDPDRACPLPGELGETEPRHPLLRPNKLLFYLIRARGLPAADEGDSSRRPSSDPCAILDVPLHPQSGWASTTKWTTLVPTWCELFEWEDFDDLEFPLTLNMVDKDEGVDDDDDVLASVAFDLETLSNRQTVRGWYPLTNEVEDPGNYWTKRALAEKEDTSPRVGELVRATAKRSFVPESDVEMPLSQGQQVDVLKAELTSNPGWVFASSGEDSGYVPRNYLSSSDYCGKVEIAMRWVHDPEQVVPLPFVMTHPKDAEKNINAVRVRVFKCKSLKTAPSTLACDVWLDDEKCTTRPSTRLQGTRFTSWSDDFLLPLNGSTPSIKCRVRESKPDPASSEDEDYGGLEPHEQEVADYRNLVKECLGTARPVKQDVTDGVVIGELDIPYNALKKVCVRGWYPMDAGELEVAFLLVHDSTVEYESNHRKHATKLQEAEDEARGYSLQDQAQLADGEDRFYVRLKFEAGDRIRGELDSYTSLCSRCLLCDEPEKVRDEDYMRVPVQETVARTPGDWYVYEIPNAFAFGRSVGSHRLTPNLRENMLRFSRKCFASGYKLQGSHEEEAGVLDAVDAKRDFALYLDVPRKLFDEWADDLFDVYTKTHEGPFEVDGVKYDPNANPPDESGAMVVKNGWVSGFGEAKKKWKQIEAGQRERAWREAHPNADAEAEAARFEAKFARWNVEEEHDPAAIARRAAKVEAERQARQNIKGCRTSADALAYDVDPHC